MYSSFLTTSKYTQIALPSAYYSSTLEIEAMAPPYPYPYPPYPYHEYPYPAPPYRYPYPASKSHWCSKAAPALAPPPPPPPPPTLAPPPNWHLVPSSKGASATYVRCNHRPSQSTQIEDIRIEVRCARIKTESRSIRYICFDI